MSDINHNIFLMYARTIQLWNYHGQESRKQFAVYDSDKPLTLKQGHSHQTWYELIDPKQGYDKAKFGKLYLNSVREEVINIHVRKSELVVYTESGMNEWSSVRTTIMQSLTLIYHIQWFTVSKNIAMLKFLPLVDNQPA